MSKSVKDFEGLAVTERKPRIEEPHLYRVLLHNDDYTSMDFVVAILERVFNKSTAEATRIMLNVHQQGVGIAGVFNLQVAETKVAVVHELAHKNEFPLKCSIERI